MSAEELFEDIMGEIPGSQIGNPTQVVEVPPMAELQTPQNESQKLAFMCDALCAEIATIRSKVLLSPIDVEGLKEMQTSVHEKLPILQRELSSLTSWAPSL